MAVAEVPRDALYLLTWTTMDTTDIIEIRPAEIGDLDAMMAMLEECARKELVLPRTRADVAEQLPHFIVAVTPDGAIAGTVALRPFGGGFYEVRSLVVSPAFEGRGIGSMLVRRLMDDWRRITPAPVSLFVFTRRPNLFRRLGFVQVRRECFAEKILADCLPCPHYNQCDEIPLEIRAG